MKLRRRAALDGVQLDSLDERILIQGVETGAGKEQISTLTKWGGHGSRVTGRHRDSLDVVVRFSINEKSYNPEERADVMEKVIGWAAAGGWLTLEHKPGRKIRVFAAQLPGEGDLCARNQYSITFRACGVPYWQEEEAEKTRITGSSGSVTFGVGGNQETVMECSFKNTSGSTIASLTVRAGDSAITFSSLGLGNGETLTIDHTDDGEKSVLRMRIGTRSVFAARTEGSADDLWIDPGEKTVSFSAGGSGVMEFSCRGRFG